MSLVVVEARAALASAVRGKRLSAGQLKASKAELTGFVQDLHLVEVTEELIDDAAQLAEAEALRGDDAVHLATALFVGAGADDRRPRAVRGLRTASPAHHQLVDFVTAIVDVDIVAERTRSMPDTWQAPDTLVRVIERIGAAMRCCDAVSRWVAMERSGVGRSASGGEFPGL